MVIGFDCALRHIAACHHYIKQTVTMQWQVPDDAMPSAKYHKRWMELLKEGKFEAPELMSKNDAIETLW